MTGDELKFRLALLWDRILCSRPFLALHVLMGNPVMYRCKVQGTVVCDETNRGIRIVRNTFSNAAARRDGP